MSEQRKDQVALGVLCVLACATTVAWGMGVSDVCDHFNWWKVAAETFATGAMLLNWIVVAEELSSWRRQKLKRVLDALSGGKS